MTDLGKPNFLDSISQGRYGKTGGYVLIEPQSKMIIAATDKTRIMTPLPATGINPMLDRYMKGYEGSGIIVDSRGLEVLSSASAIFPTSSVRTKKSSSSPHWSKSEKRLLWWNQVSSKVIFPSISMPRKKLS
ncbi:MAG: hypothetical protein V1844_12555 [Pseudomonadota bacterium]